MGNLKDAIQSLNKNTINTMQAIVPVKRTESTPVIESRPITNVDIANNTNLPTLATIEKQYLFTVLNYTKGNKSAAAKILGVTIKTLYNKLHAYGVFEQYASKQSTTPGGNNV